MKISSWRLLEPRKRKLEVQVRKGKNNKLRITGDTSSTAGWQTMSLMKIDDLKMERKRSGILGRKKQKEVPHPLHITARTRKVLHYANSGIGGEYLCEFSSLVLMTSLVRISESGREEEK